MRRSIYWITTVLLVLAMASGGLAEVTRQPQTIDGMWLLGYPVYFIVLLGCWKLAGSVALLVPRLPRVKEWAYAGIFFNMTGAAISHAVCADGAWHVVVTLGFAGLTIASWATRPPGRVLG
jgi:hypothetical protein